LHSKNHLLEVENTTEESYKKEPKRPQPKNDESAEENGDDAPVAKPRKDSSQGIEVSDLESLRWCYIA